MRIEFAAEASLAAIRARNRFGIAMAAMIKMIATTIKSSINEKPLVRIVIKPSLTTVDVALAWPVEGRGRLRKCREGNV